MHGLFKVTGDRFNLFVPLMKVNEDTGEFEGWATLEQLDHSNEICDVEKSWPFFKAWSDKLAKATDGENLGNVREMHENIAAGKLTALEKMIHPLGVPGIYVKGIAVDAGSKDKLVKRVLVGLSIGGRYVEKSKDPNIDGAMRFVADPIEISLVDQPCVPDAMITVVKADGREELAKAVGFQPSQFWKCRAGATHEHVTKAEARSCDGTKKVADVSRAILEKSLYSASSLASVILQAQGVINDLAWESRYEGDPADASPNDKLVAATALLFDALLEIIDDEKSDFVAEYGDGTAAAASGDRERFADAGRSGGRRRSGVHAERDRRTPEENPRRFEIAPRAIGQREQQHGTGEQHGREADQESRGGSSPRTPRAVCEAVGPRRRRRCPRRDHQAVAGGIHRRDRAGRRGDPGERAGEVDQ
jgi:hypothetical protein